MDYDLGIRIMAPSVPGDRPMAGTRVLFLDNSYTFGGAITCLSHLVIGLERLGVECLVASGQPKHVMESLFGAERSISVKVPATETLIRRRLLKTNPDSQVLRLLGSLEAIVLRILPAAMRFAWIGYKYDVDMVHLNNTLESQLEGLLAARMLRVPCISHARGFQYPGRLVRYLTKKVAHFIAISRAVKENLLEMGISDDRISLVHDAIDTREFTQSNAGETVRCEFGIPPDSPVFGMVGRIVQWKGVKEFVAAAVRVLQVNDHVYALIVGDESDGSPSYFRDVRQLAERSSVGDRILFTGYRADIPAIMQALDVVVHTSVRPEPFGLVVAEAMATGKPVVAANQGGPLDIVVEGETGFLVDPTDSEALAQSIGRLLSDPELARKMGQAGRKRARNHFDTKQYARQVADIYGHVRQQLQSIS